MANLLQKSMLWQQRREFSLVDNMRVGGDDLESQEFRDFLLRVGDGSENIARDGASTDLINIPQQFVVDGVQPSSLCDAIYPNLDRRRHVEGYSEWLQERVIVTSDYTGVDLYNSILIAKLSTESRIYISEDESDGPLRRNDQNADMPIDFLNGITLSSLPPHRLELKVGVPVLLIRTINAKEGHCNGSRYVVTGLHTRNIECEALSGPKRGKRVLFSKMKFKPNEMADLHFRRTQFPLRPAFAMTSNKVQGQTLEKVGISLVRQFFTHGQLYVAMSRVKSPHGLSVLCGPHPVTADPEIKNNNIVFRELLREE